jgi:hypothetical protein
VKRSALLLLTAIYLLSCLGMGVNRFYCCGKLASITLTYGAADATNNPSADKDNCCKNEKQGFKIKDTHFSTACYTFNHPSPTILPSFIAWNSLIIIQENPLSIGYQSNAPPGSADIPIYTRNCTYKI